MKDQRSPQQLTPLANAIASLERLHERVLDQHFMAAQDDVVRLGLQAGLIQNLEFTYELCWKSIRRWLANNVSPDSADGVSRRELFRLAAENRLLEDVDEWMVYHEARNQTSHRYDSALAADVLGVIGNFIHAAHHLHDRLAAHHD
jgi:nucleotidyltransferase substrate binding protein (TIGR01987 family)